MVKVIRDILDSGSIEFFFFEKVFENQYMKCPFLEVLCLY